jgi:hypothetical protein
MWVLVYIQLFFPTTGFYEVDAQTLGQYDNFVACFTDREYFVIEQTGKYDGFPLPGTQAVCIYTDGD